MDTLKETPGSDYIYTISVQGHGKYPTEEVIKDPKVKVLEADLLKGIPYKAEMIVANLMHNLVMQLAPDAYTHLDAGGVFISSGILLEKRDQVAVAIETAGFEILEIPEDGEWCAIAARKG